MVEHSQDNTEVNDLSGEWGSSFESQLAQALSDESTGAAPSRYGYRIGSLGLLVPEERLAEVAMDAVVHPIPNTQKWFAGMVNMRGNLVPVFDIKMCLGGTPGEDEKPGKRNILILDSGEQAVGVMIDALPVAVDVEQLSTNSTLDSLPEILRDFVEKLYVDQAQSWVEVDIERLMEHIGAMAGQTLCE